MTLAVSGILLSKWADMEIDEFTRMTEGLSKFQKDSLATSLRELYYEVLYN